MSWLPWVGGRTRQPVGRSHRRPRGGRSSQLPPRGQKREENVQLDDQEEELLHSQSPEAEEGESHAKEGFTQ